MLHDFNFDLPQELIAQYPLERGSSRLLYSAIGTIQDMQFRDITRLFQPGDVLVLNNTQVIPSCLYGSVTGSKIKVNLINKITSNAGEKWEFLSKPRKKTVVGSVVRFSDKLVGVVVEKFNKNNMDVIEFFGVSDVDKTSEQIPTTSACSGISAQSNTNDMQPQAVRTLADDQAFIGTKFADKTNLNSDISDTTAHLFDTSAQFQIFKQTSIGEKEFLSVSDADGNITESTDSDLQSGVVKVVQSKNITCGEYKADNYQRSSTFTPAAINTTNSIEIENLNSSKIKTLSQVEFYKLLDEIGQMPLPPYIKRDATTDDQNTYQTVFSKVAGSVAAPTAGLHFTEELLAQLQSIGVKIAYVTLHVGGGTFLPVRTEKIADHKMHSEFYSIDAEICDLINNAKLHNKRIIAVGTTVTRTLESAANFCGGELYPHARNTNIFIRENYNFKIVNCLITNFHLPKSTLFMLVCAFLGSVAAGQALYSHAIDTKYRFFSYGDACFLTR